PLLRDALKRMGRADLIGNGKKHLIPSWQPAVTRDTAATPKEHSPSGPRRATKAPANRARRKVGSKPKPKLQSKPKPKPRGRRQ
ncbi:MAG: DUF3362 domain-containing protein, partial [Gammaproteobacteria bacterium]|nr:DUF3362 domain-containing protein [Gammaproteobacteria bacterium]